MTSVGPKLMLLISEHSGAEISMLYSTGSEVTLEVEI
jgi:hypothetical protein